MRTFLYLAFTTCFFQAAIAQKESGYHIDKELAITTALEIDATYAVIRITGASRENAHIKVDRSLTSYSAISGTPDLSLDIEEVNGVLKIKEKRGIAESLRRIGYIPEAYRIIIEVPERVNVTVRGEDNSVIFQNLLGQVDVNLQGESSYEVRNCPRVKASTRKAKAQPNN